MHHEYSLSPQDAYFQRERFNHKHDAVERAITLVGSSIMALLGLRFVFALLAANSANGLASFIYTITEPLVMPFYGLFNYDHASVGSISFQGYTLVAICAYGLLTAGIAKAVTITRY
jgi:hypothetical protein